MSALSLGTSLPAVDPHASVARMASIHDSPDIDRIDHIAAQNVNATSENQRLTDDVEAFYSVGNNRLGIGSPPTTVNMQQEQSLHHSDTSYASHENRGSGAMPSDTGGLQSEKNEGNYTNFSNLFTESGNFLQKQGGPSDPLAMFKLQAQMVEVTLNWSLYGQMASKAVSGIQSLFNNQV
jgi:hypothetical protein